MSNLHWKRDRWTMGAAAVLAVALAACAEVWAAPAILKPQPVGVPVSMVVTVDGHGNEAPAVPEQDVVVSQGRRHPEIVSWIPAQGSRAGMQLLLLLDDSSRLSLGGHTASLSKFIEEQPATTLIGVGYMHDGFVEMVQNFTADRGAAIHSFRLPMGAAVGAASPYFSLMDLVKHWSPDPAYPRREVLLMSDGIDPYSGGEPEDPYVDQAVAAVQRAGIQVFTIYTPGGGRFGARPGPQFWGENYLSTLAEQSGGQSLYNGYVSAVSFAPFLDELGQILNRQYLLTFLAEPDKKAGRQNVKVRTTSGIKLIAPEQVEVPGAED